MADRASATRSKTCSTSWSTCCSATGTYCPLSSSAAATTDTNGYKLIAAFDNSPEEVGKEINGIQILHVDQLEDFCAEHKPEVAVLCVPRSGAEELSGRLVGMGIKGFWNFSHYDLSVPYPEVVVENVHLGDSLMSLGYRLRNQD